MPDKERTLGKPPIVPDSCSQVDNAERNKKLEAQVMQQNPNTTGYEYLLSLQWPTCTHYTEMTTHQLTGATPQLWTLKMRDSALTESSLTQMWRVPLQPLSQPEIVQGSALPTEPSCFDIGGRLNHDLALQPNSENGIGHDHLEEDWLFTYWHQPIHDPER